MTLHRRLSLAWYHMMHRCYLCNENLNPTYLGCSVDPRFHNLQDFLDWAYQQFGHDHEGSQLDKDILIKGNKVYGPETCCFVPGKINLLFCMSRKDRGEYPPGVCKRNGRFFVQCAFKGKRYDLGRHATVELAFAAYKAKKEENIRLMAEEYRNSIAPKVFDALMAYKVEITD